MTDIITPLSERSNSRPAKDRKSKRMTVEERTTLLDAMLAGPVDRQLSEEEFQERWAAARKA